MQPIDTQNVLLYYRGTDTSERSVVFVLCACYSVTKLRGAIVHNKDGLDLAASIVVADRVENNMKTPDARRRAFTLIELLVVIAIIAILAAILFPVFAKAREKARQTSCASNLKQLNLAVLQYNQDYDEKMPNASIFDSTHGSWEAYSWKEQIYSYVKSRQVYVCPSNSTNTNTTYLSDWVTNTNTFDGMTGLSTDYACNANYSRNSNRNGNNNPGDGSFSVQSTAPNNLLSTSIAQFAAPSQTITILEAAPDNGNAPNIDITASNFANSLFAGHTGLTNCAFADGHVKSLKPASMLSVADGGSNSSNPWTADGFSFSDQTSDNHYQASDLPNATTMLTNATKRYQ